MLKLFEGVGKGILGAAVEEAAHGTRVIRMDRWRSVIAPSLPKASKLPSPPSRPGDGEDRCAGGEKAAADRAAPGEAHRPHHPRRHQGLDPNVPMKDSGVEWLGEIPAHWEASASKRVLRTERRIKTRQFGSQLQSAEMQSGDIKVYNRAAYGNEDLTGSPRLRLTRRVRGTRIAPSSRPYRADLLVTARGSIGRCAVLPEDAKRGILHPCLMRVQPDQHEADFAPVQGKIKLKCASCSTSCEFVGSANDVNA